MIKKVLAAGVTRDNLLHTVWERKRFFQLGDIIIKSRNNIAEIPKLFDNLKRTILVVDLRTWLSSHIFEYPQQEL